MNDITLSLMHHGITGMHWGEQNGPPYPLVTRTHNLRSKEERAKVAKTAFAKPQPKRIKKSENFYDKLKSKKKNPYTKSEKNEPTKTVKNDKIKSKQKNIDGKKVALAVGAVAATAAIAAGAAFVISGKSGIMLRDLNNARLSQEALEGKRYLDFTIKKGQLVQTLSFDPNRIADPDNKYGGYIYAAVTDHDKTEYGALFNRLSLNKEIFKDKTKTLPEKLKEFTAGKYKFSLKAMKDINVASEMASSEALENMMRADKGLVNFVTDTIINGKTDSGMPYIPEYKLKNYGGYAEAVEVAKKARERLASGKPLTSKQADTMYRLFNLALPIDDPTAKMYRERFFKNLKASGYGGILDTNDSMYGMYKSEKPVILFDMDSLITDSVKQTRLKDILKDQINFSKGLIKGRKEIINNLKELKKK